MTESIKKYVFFSNHEITQKSLAAGIDGVVIDWEQKNKSVRQKLYDTQINEHTVDDLIDVRAQSNCWIICRINGGELVSKDEINKALDHGANEIMVPMISEPAQLEFALKAVDGRAKVMAMIETEDAVRQLHALAEFPVHRFYVGLNDLAISRNASNIFIPIADGTMDKIRARISGDFGFAGLTHPAMGNPISARLLMAEMRSLRCSFSFLRRSYFRDLQFSSEKEIVHAINQDFIEASSDNDMIRRAELYQTINEISLAY